MVDHTAVQLALRSRVLALSVCTTGLVSLAARKTGYTRLTGSFIDDGFAEGMEITPAGFADDTRRVVQAVTALELLTSEELGVEPEAAGRSLSVGAPEMFRRENVTFKPAAGRPYLEDDYVPATAQLLSLTRSNGFVQDTGLYVLRWFGLGNRGLPAITKAMDALLAMFPPGGEIAFTGGVVRVRGDFAPHRGQILPAQPGWFVVTVTVPWRIISLNPSVV